MWILILTAAVVFIIIILTRALFHICFRRKFSPLARYVIRKAQKNGTGMPAEAQSGREFWLSAKPEAVHMTSYDGLSLYAEYYEAPHAERTIVCVHGYRVTGIANFAPVLPVWAEMNCSILLIDQRACGKSAGNYITMGLKERYDVRDWCRWLTDVQGVSHPIYLDGVSMGGACVLMASNLDLPSNVCGIIADCGYTSPYEIIQSVAGRLMHLPSFPIMPLLQLGAMMTFHMKLDAVSTRDCVSHTSVPILFAHGEQDLFVPVSMTEETYRLCSSQKWLLLSPEAAHGEAWVKSRSEYMALIHELFTCTNLAHTQEV